MSKKTLDHYLLVVVGHNKSPYHCLSSTTPRGLYQ